MVLRVFWHHVDESEVLFWSGKQTQMCELSLETKKMLLSKQFKQNLKSLSQFSDHPQPFDNYHVTPFLFL